MWNIFYDIIVDHANSHCPLVNMYVNEKCPYWFSRDLIEEINYKNSLYRKAKTSGIEEDWLSFKLQRNVVKGLIFRAKYSYVKEQLDLNLNDSRKLWKNVSALSGLGKDKANIGITEIENGIDDVLKGQEAADYINDFHTSVGLNINRKFTENWKETDF